MEFILNIAHAEMGAIQLKNHHDFEIIQDIYFLEIPCIKKVISFDVDVAKIIGWPIFFDLSIKISIDLFFPEILFNIFPGNLLDCVLAVIITAFCYFLS